MLGLLCSCVHPHLLLLHLPLQDGGAELGADLFSVLLLPSGI